MSQKAKILEYLKSGNSITTASAVDLWRCYRVSERIRELERDGHVINHQFEVTPGGTRIVRYSWAGHVDVTKTKRGFSGIQITLPKDLFPSRTDPYSDYTP